jgi:phage terminase large subunit
MADWLPLPWQIAPWRDKSLVLLLTGAAGGGKSNLAAQKVHAYLLRYPNATGLMMRKTRQSMINSTVLYFEKSVLLPADGVRHVRSKNRFEYPNGSILAYGGMADEEQKEQIRSIGQAGGVDIAWMEEANRFTEDDYQELLGRMRGHAANWQQVILTTNPDAPTHWIKQRLIDGGEAAVYYSAATDNRHNPATYLATLGRLTGVAKARLVEGQWVQAEGVVYEEYDDAVHYIEPFPIPQEWRRIRSIDFGYTNPFVCQWWAIDPDERMYLYRELYMTGRTVADHAQRIKQLSAGETYAATICDHDAEDRATLMQNGIPNAPADKRLSVGIEHVKERLKIAGDGKPRIFFVRGALVERDESLVAAKRPCSTVQEITSYVWPKGIDGKAIKETPVDLDNHGMDAMRYAVMAVDNRALWQFKQTQRERIV